MSLAAGSKLGPYEIQSPLGAGGMGEVYRARDTRLDRDVAIKVLPANLSSDPALRQRLEREAKAVSKLSHPHICTLHDIGHQDGVDFLVMELVEGETLEQRLMKGPLPAEQTVRYAAQIADALAKAHKQGITHRDLKPANVMLTKAGAKLMDFGLAKQAETAPLAAALTEMTMEQSKLTGEGTIVGTFQYMAPEQLEGKEADARTDIFALGELIYEMVAGKPAFAGKSRASLIASILTNDPPPITQLQPMTPATLERVVKKCLAKDPEERWQSASDLASELKWIVEGGSSAALPIAGAGAKRHNRVAWVSTVVASVVALAFAALYFWHSGQPLYPIRTFIPPPADTAFIFFGDAAGPLVLSPDGRNLVFLASTVSGAPRLYLRPLDALEARPLPGTENAMFPFWSPDGRMIGFFADGKLKTTDIQGGGAIPICDAPNSRGGSWGPDGTILFAPEFRSALYRVPAGGGTPVQVTRMDESRHTSHRWPFFLPDGKHFLYLAINHQNPQDENDAIYYASLDGKQNQLLLHAFSNAQYASGLLLYLRNGVLEAQSFAPESGKLVGDPHPVASGVTDDGSTWRGIFTVSSNGMLAYSGGAQSQSQLAWFDRSGKQLGTVGEKVPGLGGGTIRLSPSGDRVAFPIQGSVTDIWVMDVIRGVRTRLTFGPVGNGNPAWSPDGKWIAYDTISKQGSLINRRPAAGGGEEVLLPEGSPPRNLADWSRDGKYLLYEKGALGTRQEIWAAPLSGGQQPFPVVPPGAFYSNSPRFSPDGRWVAYQSNESGRVEIYVVPFRGGQGKWQVSTSGGAFPVWRGDGKEIFYVSADGLLTAVPIVATPDQIQPGKPQPLFRAAADAYDISPDGKRLLLDVVGDQNIKPITVVLNWTAELTK
jgi:eukaryotic-like serine/threonine-protein kinase